MQQPIKNPAVLLTMVNSANRRSRLVLAEMSPYPTDISVAIVQYKLARYCRHDSNKNDRAAGALSRCLANEIDAGSRWYQEFCFRFESVRSVVCLVCVHGGLPFLFLFFFVVFALDTHTLSTVWWETQDGCNGSNKKKGLKGKDSKRTSR